MSGLAGSWEYPSWSGSWTAEGMAVAPAVDGPARLSWITPVRGTDTPYNTPDAAEFTGLSQDFLDRGLKSTWLARHDALTSSTFGSRLDTLAAAGHEIGIWIEINSALNTAAGVDFNASNSGVARTPLYHLIRYGPAERLRIIDALMAAYFARYSAYPRTAGFWLIDSYSAAYLRSAYAVNCLVFCRDQWVTDAEELRFGWRNCAWESPSDWFGVPNRPAATGRGHICVFRNISVDLTANYGVTGSSNTPTHEPSGVYRGSKTVAGVWTPNVNDVADRPPTPPVILTPFMESGWTSTWDPANGYVVTARAALDSTVTLSGAGTVVLKTCEETAAEFLSQTTADRDRPVYLHQTTDNWFGTADEVMWYQGLKYTARFRWRSHGSLGWMAATDLRVMDGPDPYTATCAGSGAATWESAWVVDGSRYTPTAGPGVERDTQGTALACLRVRTNFGSASDDRVATHNLTVSAVPETDSDSLTWARDSASFSAQMKPRGIVWNLAGTATGSSQTLRLALTAATGVDNQTQTYSTGSVETATHQTSGSATQSEIGQVLDYFYVTYDNRDAAVIFWPLAKTGGATWSGALGTASYVEFGLLTTGAGVLTAQIAVVPCRKSEVARVLALLASSASTYLAGTADPVGPRLSSAAVNTAGSTLTLTFDRAATGQTGWSLLCSGGSQALTASGGNGTTTHTFTLTRNVKSDEKLAVNFVPGSVVDASGNPLEPLTRWIDNASTRTDAMPTFAVAPSLWVAAGPYWCTTDLAKTTQSWGGASRVAVWTAGTGGDLTVGTVEDKISMSRSGTSWRVGMTSTHLRIQGAITAIAATSAFELQMLARFDAIPTGGNETPLIDVRSAGQDIASIIAQSAGTLFRVRNSAATLRDANPGTPPDTSLHVYGLSVDGSGLTAWLDGTSIATQTAPGGTFTFNRLTLGSTDDGATKTACTIIAVYLVPSVLSAPQRAAVVATLQAMQ